MKQNFSIYIFLCILFLGSAACQDDLLYNGGEIGEGESLVSATVNFKPLTPALNGHTRAAGDIIKSINSLCVLLYNEEGELLNTYPLKEAAPGTTPGEGEYTLTNENRSEDKKTESIGGEDKKLPSAESQTPHADFKLTIPYGRYYIYAVANMDNLLTNESYSKAIQTIEGLKSISLTWDADNIAANNQMFGYFTTGSEQQGELAVINQSATKLHAWIRRAASKVTVAYDGSQLKEGVFIYLQSVQIKDIPLQCYLGKDNNVGKEGYPLEIYPEESKETKKMLDGEIISYHEGDKPDDFEYGEDCAGHRVTVGAPYFGSHDENADALYFYENMQGAGDNMPDKRQDANKDGELDYPGLPNNPDKYPNYRPKDNVPYGTYIEVHAHYISNNSERLGNGHIIYRFMLGQDVIKDYNAKRNCHYKLTLKFKNFANEADWHIEYEEPVPGVMTPEPYYISYLYNHSLMYPIKVNTGGREIEYMKAEIIDNRWAPYNADKNAVPPIYYHPMDIKGANPWNGFLSLHKTVDTTIPDEGGSYSATSNQAYYEKEPHRGLRTYTEFSIGEHTTQGALEKDKYRVEKHPTEENTYNIYIPMYTRAKLLIKSTGYTGNNPYVAYQRRAEVEITTKLKGIETPFVNRVPIYQVRRIVNPKGIYRKTGNNSSFHVVLKRLPQENAQYFKDFQSEGPWKAYIIRSTSGSGITLSATPEKSELKDDSDYGKAIHGKTGSVIDFNVDFNGGENNSNHYAIIRVEYHNYTCQHLIFVRQGNEPDDLIDGGTKWYAENMRSKTHLASTPLDEGSLFKFGNWEQPIDALNNKNPKEWWVNIGKDDFKVYPENGFVIADNSSQERKTWTEITEGNANSEFEAPNEQMRVANYQDYKDLDDASNIEFGYGILYGDESTETADDIITGYGYDYQNTKRGMRGCFVYNSDTGKNLFFPIGASGYGHRKNQAPSWSSEKEPGLGVLRYASGRTNYFPEGKVGDAYPNGVADAPLFYDIFRRPGAIYWLNKNYFENYENVPAWDFNYFTFDFNRITNTSVGDYKDACFVRCVVK